MNSTMTALAEPHRRAIVDALRHGDAAVGDLVRRVGLSQPGMSKHLRVLREAGLVSVRKDAQRRVYSLGDAPLAELDAWLAPYRDMWNVRAGRRPVGDDSLDALGAHLESIDEE